MFAIKNNQIYIHCVNGVLFYIALVWHLFDVVDGCISPAPAYLSKVVNLARVCTLLPID